MSLIYEIMDYLLPFSMFRYAFMKNALLAILLITPLLGLLGTMTVNNRMAFFSDALGHSALTGIALGVSLGVEDTLLCLLGFGVFLALVITRVQRSGTASKDTIIGVFSSVSVALGLVVLSRGGNFSAYSAALTGDILSITPREIFYLAIMLITVSVLWRIFYNRLLLVSLNASLAASRGIHVQALEYGFVCVVAVAVMLSVRAVGVLMINSLLVLPAAASRNITRSSRGYQALSLVLAVGCGLAGLLLSYALDTSAAAAIVLLLAICFGITWLLNRLRNR
ncbi:MAG: metal ABC transporter permease [Christensenellales bacterium]|jgi:zinc transport system permease protein